MFIQWRQMRTLLVRPNPGSSVWIALSSKRLPLHADQSARATIGAYARMLPGVLNPDELACELTGSPILFVFDPAPVSALWSSHKVCCKEKILIMDYSFLAIILAMSPLNTLTKTWGHRRLVFSRFGKRDRNGTLATAAAAFFAAAYGALLDRTGKPKAYLFTSNSFSTEVLRCCLLNSAERPKVTEILHGVPTLEFEEYFCELLGRAPAPELHHFVPQIPGLPAYGVLTSMAKERPETAINAAVNCYFLERSRNENVGGWLARECSRLQPDGRRHLIVAVMGAASHDKDYLSSRIFGIEQALMRAIHQTLTNENTPFMLFYLPHPAHSKTLFKNTQFFEHYGISLNSDTTLMWLVADLCVALYSTALFEAAFSGAHVFTPMRHDDQIYPSILLDRLHHPVDTQSCGQALTAYLQRYGRPQSENIFESAILRATRLTELINLPSTTLSSDASGGIP